mgnify:CR=1 FL=1
MAIGFGLWRAELGADREWEWDMNVRRMTSVLATVALAGAATGQVFMGTGRTGAGAANPSGENRGFTIDLNVPVTDGDGNVIGTTQSVEDKSVLPGGSFINTGVANLGGDINSALGSTVQGRAAGELASVGDAVPVFFGVGPTSGFRELNDTGSADLPGTLTRASLTYNPFTERMISITRDGRIFETDVVDTVISEFGGNLPSRAIDGPAEQVFGIPQSIFDGGSGTIIGAAFDSSDAINPNTPSEGLGLAIDGDSDVVLFSFGPGAQRNVIGDTGLDFIVDGQLADIGADLNVGLAFDATTQTLLMSVADEDAGTTDFYAINRFSGLAGLVFSTDVGAIGGLAPNSAAPIPTPGAFAALAGAGLLASRRRRV